MYHKPQTTFSSFGHVVYFYPAVNISRFEESTTSCVDLLRQLQLDYLIHVHPTPRKHQAFEHLVGWGGYKRAYHGQLASALGGLSPRTQLHLPALDAADAPMISVFRTTELTLTRRQQPSSNRKHDPITTDSNMVVSSRSRGRINLRSDQELLQSPSQPESSSPVTPNIINDHNTDASLPRQHDDAGSSRAKRNRIASVSDRESVQKRRRLSKGSVTGPSPVHIPLRGRAVPDVQPANHGKVSYNHTTVQPPSLLTHDSSVSNSPLNSPPYGPQYDQFRRIEEKAQRVVKKHLQQEEKRILRSEHGSTRSKTELAQYFPNFDDMLSLEPVDPNLLTAKTPIVLVDDTPNFVPAPPRPDYFRSLQAPHNAETIDLEEHLTSTRPLVDPLSDAIYLKAHQKAERHEKQMKNGDKERAQHEKYQLERLLEELRGPEWLKTLGISGITDTEKKRFEAKRKLFIRETQALIAKFKRWKEEEKRRKLEKLQLQLEGAEAASESADGSRGDDKASSSTAATRTRVRIKNGLASKSRSSRANSRPSSVSAQVPDSSEIDALASQQLLEEAKSASVHRHKANAVPTSLPIPLLPEFSRKPFTSFFEKRHIRDAAVSGRNRGRKIYAFGQELPEFEETEFELPESILTHDAIKASQRSRRRRMRSIDDGS
ncbi:hypothetical protein LTS08_000335 [Lithohypha guttulata]|nr:hypothetical protein LTS08_000335 [Lithohypha guttulata]